MRPEALVRLPPRPPRARLEAPGEAPRVGAGRGKAANWFGAVGLFCRCRWPLPLSSRVTEECSYSLDKGSFVWRPQRGQGEEGGREEHGQERVTVPPFWLVLASALGRKHLGPVDTHILCCALNALPHLERVASLSLSLSFHVWIMGIITHNLYRWR